MFKKNKSISQANSTMVKSKITWAKNNHIVSKNEFFFEYEFVIKKKRIFLYL